MATLSKTTPYKNGTLSSIGTGANGANTRLNTSGITWASGDVGRHVYFYSGDAIFESRKIIAQGTNYCDIEFPFGTFPLNDQDGDDTLSDTPSASDSIGVSYYMSDVDDGTSLVEITSDIYRQPTGEKIAIGAQVMLYDTQKSFTFDSDYIDLDGVMQFGDITPYGFTTGACELIDLADVGVTNGGGFSFTNNQVETSDDVGALRIYGGTVIAKSGSFWRIYRNSGTGGPSHIVSVMFSGAHGMRIGSSAKTILYDTVFNDNTFWAGPFTTKTPTGLLSGISVNDSENIIFWGVSFGGNATVQNVRFDAGTINTGALLLAGVTGGPYTLVVKDIPITDIEALETNSVPFATLSGTVSSTGHKVEVQNALTLSIADSSGSLQDDWRCRLTNAGGTQLLNALSVDGFWDQTWAKYADISITGVGQFPIDFSDCTTYGPYNYRMRKYGFAEINGVWAGKSTLQVDWREPAELPVVANEATASGYSSKFSINWATKTITVSGNTTPQEMYDYVQYSAAQSANIQYDMIMTATAPGEFFIADEARIVIASGGTLTVDADGTSGVLTFGDMAEGSSGTYQNYIEVQSGGTLSVGTDGRQGTLIYFGRDQIALSYQEWNQDILVKSGGTWEWFGGTIVCHNAVWCLAGSTLEISGNAQFYSDTSDSGALRFSNVDTSITELIVNNESVVWLTVPTTADLQNITYKNISNWALIGVDNDGSTGVWINLNGFDVYDATINKGFIFWDQRWARGINFADGTSVVTKGNLADHANNRGLLEIRQEISFSAASGGGAKFYTVDTDNGNRLADNQIADNPDYEADRSYTLTESGGVASYTTDGGVLTGVHWRDTGGLADDDNEFDSRGTADDNTDVFNWLKVQYGYQPATLDVVMKGTSAVSSSIAQLVDQGITESTKATVAAYTGISPVYATGTLTVTVDEDHTINEIYDFIKYYESENPEDVWANSKTSFISTSNKLSYSYSNLVIIVDGCEVTGAAGQILPTKPTVSSGGFFEDAEGAIWESSGSLYYASHAYLNVKNASTAANIEGVVIGWGDATEEQRLLYNTSLVLDTLITDASGNADGYFVYKIDSTTYADTKQVTGEYSYNFSIIPRALSGAPIGSSASREVIRLNPDTQVTNTKGDAATIAGGLSVSVSTDTIDLNDEAPEDSYDGLKWLVTADADIDTGVPGCMYYCLYGLPLTKSGTTYSGRDPATIYQNVDGTGATLQYMTVELDSSGTYSDFTFGDVQINFEDDGTYDLRGSTFNGDLTVDTIGEYTVTVQVPTGTDVTNNDETNITVDVSTVIVISNPNLVDGSRVRLYNTTQDAQIENTTVSGGSGYSYNATLGAGEEIEVGDVITLYATYASGSSYKNNYSEVAIAGSGDITYAGSQTDWTHANSLSVDGSAQTEFSSDYPNVEVDVDASGNLFNVADLVAWLIYIQTTEDGISNFFGCISSTDAANWMINTDVVDLMLDNVETATATQGDAVILMRDDSEYPQVVPTSGGGGIGMIQSGLVFVTETGVSGLTAPEAAKLDAIYSKTSPLTFDGTDLNANVTKVNEIPINGSGVLGDPWGPA